MVVVKDMRFMFCPLFVLSSSCAALSLDSGSYIKDLSVVHDDLSSIVILDNSPGAYRSHPGKTRPCVCVCGVCVCGL